MIRPTLRRGSGYADISPHYVDDVRALQRDLGRWGYTSLIPDGELGPVTEAAVRHFQRNQGFDDTGVVDARVWLALTDRPPRPVGTSFFSPEVGPTVPEPSNNAPPPEASAGGPAWMGFATREVGVHEVAGRTRANPRILEYHSTAGNARSDEVAWCSSFINWCLGKCGIAGTGSPAAISWVRWGESCAPRYGCITVLYNPSAANTRLSRSGNHCAFLVEETPTHYRLLGGNQSDQVKISGFPKRSWTLKGYRWPAGA